MSTKLTQGVVNKIAEEHQAGAQVYDADVSGLRIVVGSRSSSYKLVGRINDGSDRYVSIIIGRTDEVSLKTARERAAERSSALGFYCRFGRAATHLLLALENGAPLLVLGDGHAAFDADADTGLLGLASPSKQTLQQ